MYSTAANNPLLTPEKKPAWLDYPQQLHELVRSGRMPLIPWHFVTAESSARHSVAFRSRLGRDLVPFAYRQDREDLACFEKGKGHQVVIIHDNTDPGWEDVESYPSFADWLRAVDEEAAAWVPISEEDMRAIRKRFGFDD